MCLNTGDGAINYSQANLWFDFLESNKISWCKWSVADLAETSAVLKEGTDPNGGWTEENLSESGVFIRDKIISSYNAMFTSVEPEKELDTRYSLFQNYPNPFNPTTKIGFILPESSNIRLAIYSLLGERVAVLLEGFEKAGQHEIIFNTSDLPSGIYMYQLCADSYTKIRKMELLK